MAMVSVDDSSQSFGGVTAQIGWFGLRVGGAWGSVCIHQMNRVNSRNDCVMMTTP